MQSQELFPGIPLYIFDELPTTMAEGRRLSEVGAVDGTTVVTHKQTQGRGRLGRSWVSEPGNLYLTTILRPQIALRDAGKISLMVGLALRQVLSAYLPQKHIQLKWPNDVLIQGQKVAGILLEMLPGSAAGHLTLLVGIGVNVSHFPEDTRYPATSLATHGIQMNPLQLVQPLVRELLNIAENFLKTDGIWQKQWMEAAYGLGKPILLTHESGEIAGQGIYKGIDQNGSLLIEDESGAMRAYYVGDVVFQKTPLRTTFVG